MEQNVLLAGSFSPVSNNPTSPEYKAQEYLIGLFHTHPTLYGCGNATRNPGASQKDIDSAAVREFGLPGFVYDYVSFVDTHLPINANAKIYKYGAPGRFPNTY
ncbi:hypothetical protein [Sphingobacterium siyangense]|uniref:hypothetical protein n=1 Tax=Sphingobacterium siyangense TaxID=459529 RepID=UPI003C78C909